MYLDSFTLPISQEEKMIGKRMKENGGDYGYIDNIYPCRFFGPKELSEINFRNVTIFYTDTPRLVNSLLVMMKKGSSTAYLMEAESSPATTSLTTC